ncbi:HlyD family secretion protein [Mucilaginibacter sp. 5C4]|uniref:HlyD family efflux transporter periplasmic adaptor subunit n=1 Tax=Mucilaginibacter sp. 5C4 TaxID=3048589 RepID=UPI002AC9DEB9|nr:HlyD family secretion protein [Mucilaginibacter sp. 5C4]MEB0263195.1 HlyD family secretion protein [Mucilaginibacter sp. 10I4]MEB0280093.1 HlyD family secretion protein [Mucilaginibacter sp. 10B2]MEB0301071.1 HlyD family secretion protein [Mucilaginibacter sp. 5C4]WPX24498.1 HlyD family secretion protein [Mucilaginibacter sp. 5C4]
MPLKEKNIAQARNSPELDEVISKPPPSLIGWGISTMTVILTILILISACVQYPTLINSSKTILNIEKNGTLTARTLVSERDISRIQKGQLVYIRLTAYPADKFGQLRGKITRVEGIQNDGDVTVMVTTISTISDAGKSIPVFSGMTGESHILTDKASLLRRMYVQLMEVNFSK